MLICRACYEDTTSFAIVSLCLWRKAFPAPSGSEKMFRAAAPKAFDSAPFVLPGFQSGLRTNPHRSHPRPRNHRLRIRRHPNSRRCPLRNPTHSRCDWRNNRCRTVASCGPGSPTRTGIHPRSRVPRQWRTEAANARVCGGQFVLWRRPNARHV